MRLRTAITQHKVNRKAKLSNNNEKGPYTFPKMGRKTSSGLAIRVGWLWSDTKMEVYTL